MIERISAAVSKENLNILDMLNRSRGEVACTLVDVERPVPRSVVDEISKIEGVLPGAYFKLVTASSIHSLLHESWADLTPAQQVEQFKKLSVAEAKRFLVELSTWEQARLLSALDDDDRWLWLRALAPDDAADVLQHVLPGGIRAIYRTPRCADPA